MRKICFCVNIGNYDLVKKPFLSKGWEYILINDTNEQVEGWTTMTVPQEKDKIRQARRLKICPPFECDESIYFDARFEIRGDLNEMLKDVQGNLAVTRHPLRTKLSEEAIAVIDAKKEDENVVLNQINQYILDGFMPLAGLPATGILYRKGNLRSFNEAWMNEIMQHSVRDQLSMQYSSWKTNTPYEFMPYDVYDSNSKYFSLGSHL